MLIFKYVHVKMLIFCHPFCNKNENILKNKLNKNIHEDKTSCLSLFTQQNLQHMYILKNMIIIINVPFCKRGNC